MIWLFLAVALSIDERSSQRKEAIDVNFNANDMSANVERTVNQIIPYKASDDAGGDLYRATAVRSATALSWGCRDYFKGGTAIAELTLPAHC